MNDRSRLITGPSEAMNGTKASMKDHLWAHERELISDHLELISDESTFIALEGSVISDEWSVISDQLPFISDEWPFTAAEVLSPLLNPGCGLLKVPSSLLKPESRPLQSFYRL